MQKPYCYLVTLLWMEKYEECIKQISKNFAPFRPTFLKLRSKSSSSRQTHEGTVLFPGSIFFFLQYLTATHVDKLHIFFFQESTNYFNIYLKQTCLIGAARDHNVHASNTAELVLR